MIKLLIVDDSALMRRQLSSIFSESGLFEVRTARNGREAIAENREYQPDVITLDINMPEMDGLTALSHIMAERPVPVVMVSSLTEEGALATFEALNLGAVDYIPKPGGTISLSIKEVTDELLAKVKAASRAKIKQGKVVKSLSQRLREDREKTVAKPIKVATRRPVKDGIVIIGVSTGGPRTLEEILPELPADFPWPIIIAQHMPPAFTRSFADRLNAICPLEVSEATQPTVIQPGCVYVGKGGADVVITERAGRKMVLPKPEDSQLLWHPSVELLGRSALAHYEADAIIAVMLTGMGYDGADAFAQIRKAGGRTIAESEASSVVFGMPSELIDRGGATVVLSCDKVASQLISWVCR